MSDEANIRYVIDADDNISFVDESWYRFAAANDGGGLENANVLGRSLWEFIADAPTRRLYQQIVARVRQGKRTRFTLRCDGPSRRRLLEMTISARSEGAVEFETHVLSVAEREPVPLLARSTTRSTELLRTCAWCNRFNVESGADRWVEVEDATDRLLLFERDRMPQLTHGICETCLESMNGTLAKMEAEAVPRAAADGGGI